MLVGTPAAALALVLLDGLAGLAVAVLLFFAASFIADEPYRALYPDLLPAEVSGRAQSTQAIWRGVGTGLALVGGGLLLLSVDALPSWPPRSCSSWRSPPSPSSSRAPGHRMTARPARRERARWRVTYAV